MRPETFMIMNGPALKEGVSSNALAGSSPDSSTDAGATSGEKKSFENQFLTTLFKNDNPGSDTLDGIAYIRSASDSLPEGTELESLNESAGGTLSSLEHLEGISLKADDSVFNPAGVVLEPADAPLDYLKPTTGLAVPAEPTKGPPGPRGSDLLSFATEGSETGTSEEGIYFTGHSLPDVDASIDVKSDNHEDEPVDGDHEVKPGSSAAYEPGKLPPLDNALTDFKTTLNGHGETQELFTNEKTMDTDRTPPGRIISSDKAERETHSAKLIAGDVMAEETLADTDKRASKKIMSGGEADRETQSGTLIAGDVMAEETIADTDKRTSKKIMSGDDAERETHSVKLLAGDVMAEETIADTDKRASKKIMPGGEAEREMHSVKLIADNVMAEKIDNDTEGAIVSETSPEEISSDETSSEENSPEDSFSAKLQSHSGDVESEGFVDGPRKDFKSDNQYEEEERALPYEKISGTDITKDSQVMAGRAKASDVFEVIKEHSKDGVESKGAVKESHIDESLETDEMDDSFGETGEFSDDSMDEALQENFKEMEALALKTTPDSDIDSLLEDLLKAKDGKAGAVTRTPSEEAQLSAQGADKVTAKTLIPSSQGAARHQGAYISKSFESIFVKGVAARVSVAFNNNIGKATISLNPPELGKLKVEMSLKDNIMQASFRVENMNVKEALEKNLDLLKSALVEQGLSVDELNVTLDDNYRDGSAKFAGDSPQRQSNNKGEGEVEEGFVRDNSNNQDHYYSGDNSGVDLFI